MMGEDTKYIVSLTEPYQYIDYPDDLFTGSESDGNAYYNNIDGKSHKNKKIFVNLGGNLVKGQRYRLIMRFKCKSMANSFHVFIRERNKINNYKKVFTMPNPTPPKCDTEPDWINIDKIFSAQIDNADTIYFSADAVFGEGSFLAIDYILLFPINYDVKPQLETNFRSVTDGEFVLANIAPKGYVLPNNANSIKELNDTLCTGCGACYSICPNKSITMIDNDEGFKFPNTSDTCVNCGKCDSVCPILKVPKQTQASELYAVQASDAIRYQASSGGVFPVMAQKTIDDGGIVYGVAWSENYREAIHKCISEGKDLQQLFYSKYVQDNIGDSLIETKRLLEHGKKVLFSGCPCQIAGLRNFLDKEYENLMTVEIICHGVPSPLAWKKWLDWRLENETASIESVCMRDKSLGWKGKLRLVLENGTEIRETRNDVYNRSFLTDINLRKSCYYCRFKNTDMKRPADITIGDFWGVEKIDKNLDDNKGTSLVLINTEKGKAYFEALTFTMIQKLPVEKGRQRNLIKSVSLPFYKRESLFKNIHRFSYDIAVKMAEGKKSEVGILGNYTNENIGGQLTVLAAYKAVEQLGYSVKMIKFPDHFRKSQKRKALWQHLCNFTEYTMEKDLDKINDQFQSFVTCSDWTFFKRWSKGWDFYTQPWTSDDKRRIAFAASFGNGGGYEESDFDELKRRLSRFTALGIREPSGINYCVEHGIDNAIFMHDPVFSLSREFYIELSEVDAVDRPSLSTLVRGEYVVVYLRSYTAQNIKYALDISKKLNLDILALIGYESEKENIMYHNFRGQGIRFLTDVTMCEWLYFFNHSSFVVTDSFHATCFSLILNKPFVSIKRFENNKFNKLSALLGNAKLMERLIDSNLESDQVTTTAKSEIDWQRINSLLVDWRNEGVAFIDTAVNPESLKRSHENHN